MADSEVKVRITAEDKASSAIKSVVKSLGGLETGAKDVSSAFKGLVSGSAGVPGMISSMSNLTNVMSGTTLGFSGLVGAAVAAGGALVTMAVQAANAVEELENMSAITGIAAADLEGLQKIAEDAGLGSVNLATSIGMLNRQLASGEGGDFARTLGMLGGSIRDESGEVKDAITVLDEMAERLRAIEDPTLRAQLANSAFGRQLRELIPLLLNSNRSLRDMIETQKETGRVMDETTRQNMKALDQALDEMSAGWDRLKNSILSATGSLIRYIATADELHPLRLPPPAITAKDAADFEKQLREREMKAAKGVQFPPSPFTRVRAPGEPEKTPQQLVEEAEARARGISTGLEGERLEIAIKLEGLQKRFRQAQGEGQKEQLLLIAQEIAILERRKDALDEADKRLEEHQRRLERINQKYSEMLSKIAEPLPTPPVPIVGPTLWDPLLDKEKLQDFQDQIENMRFQAVDTTKAEIDAATKAGIDSAEDSVREFYRKQAKAREEARRDWEKMLDTIRDSAGEVFDAMLEKGKGVFESLANFAQGLLQSMLRNVFQNAVQTLLTGPTGGGVGGILGSIFKPGGGGGGGTGGAAAQAGVTGGILGGLGKLFGGGGAKAATGGMGAFLGESAAATTTAAKSGGFLSGLFGGGGTGMMAGLGSAASTAGISMAVALGASFIGGLFNRGAQKRAEEQARRAGVLAANQFAGPETMTRFGTATDPSFTVETDLTGRVRGIGRVPSVVVNVENNMIDARHAREAGEVIAGEVSRQILAGGSYLADNIGWAAS